MAAKSRLRHLKCLCRAQQCGLHQELQASVPEDGPGSEWLPASRKLGHLQTRLGTMQPWLLPSGLVMHVGCSLASECNMGMLEPEYLPHMVMPRLSYDVIPLMQWALLQRLEWAAQINLRHYITDSDYVK